MGTIPAPNIAELGGQIGAAPLNAFAEYQRAAQLQQQTQQAKAMAPLQQQQAQQQIEMQRRQMADQDALTRAITQYDPDKHTLADIPKLITQNGGSGQAALQAQTGLIQQRSNLAKLSDEQFAQQQKQADLIQSVHDRVSAADPASKQNEYVNGLQTLARAGVDVSKEPQQYPGDDAFAQHLPAIRLHSAIIAEADKDRETTAKESEAATKAQEAQTSAEKFRAELPGGPLAHVDQAEMTDYLRKHPGQGPSDFLSWKAKQSPMFGILGNVLPPAAKGDYDPRNPIDAAAKRYNDTGGDLPAGFSRSPGTTAAIMKRAAELPGGESLAANKVTLNADKAALAKVQTTFDQVAAFEGTALKNLDLYTQTAAKIPDLQARFANVPLRMITGKMIGEENYAAMQAARHVAATETAKVLGSATASGILSDTQQREILDIVDGNLPFGATLKVVQTLKQDLGNRHQSYQEDVNAIRKRIGAQPQESGTTGGGMVTMKAPNGATKQVSADQVEHYKSLGATVVQ